MENQRTKLGIGSATPKQIEEAFSDLSPLQNRRAALKFILIEAANGPQSVGCAAIIGQLIQGIKCAGSLEAEGDVELLRSLVRESVALSNDKDLSLSKRAVLKRKALTSAEKLVMGQRGSR
jgi:hypothetical protein